MLVFELSDDINHIKMPWELAEIIEWKKKEFNMDISLDIPYKALKILNNSKHVFMGCRCREVSQMFDLGLSFDFMKCRKLYCKKRQKFTRFLP